MVKGTDSNIIAIVVAAGSGTRFGGDVPKQFLELRGKPVLARSAFIFREVFPDCRLIIVLSADGRERWQKYCAAHPEVPEHAVVEGGDTRHDSVMRALRHASALPAFGGSTVMIHDGARPLIDADTLRELAGAAADGSNAVPALEITDSVLYLRDECIASMPRNMVRTVQTPQVFRGVSLLEAFERYHNDPKPLPVTDDLSVMMRYSPDIHTTLVPGKRRNIKITNPGDLALAEFYLDRPDL